MSGARSIAEGSRLLSRQIPVFTRNIGGAVSLKEPIFDAEGRRLDAIESKGGGASFLGLPILNCFIEKTLDFSVFVIAAELLFEVPERFISGLTAHGLGKQFEHLQHQNGMFSYSGLSKEHVLKLRSDYGVYIVDSGRVCIASMTEKNIDYIVDSIAKVVKGA